MELNVDALRVHIPAFIMVLTVLVRLGGELGQQRRFAKNLNIYKTQNNYAKGEK